LSDEAFEAYREAPGTLEERHILSCEYIDQLVDRLAILLVSCLLLASYT